MRILDTLLGKHLASDEEEDHKVGVVEGIPMLGLDALGSASYGPEAALTILLPLGALGLSWIGPLTIIILALLLILYFSYRQTINAYPTGGGSYTVAKQNLGNWAGLTAAAALTLDYILNVAVGISAGVGALISAFPSLQSHTLLLCLSILAFIALVNLRGIRESGIAFALPTYLFVISLFVVLIVGVCKSFAAGGSPSPVVPPPPLHAATTGISVWLLLRAFASGCTAMTGVEAVSNGITAFADPATKRAQQTLTAIVAILGLLLAGIAYLSRAYHVGATEPGGHDYQSVISQLVAAVVGRGIFYYITIGSVLAVLCLSANTSFSGFPRLCQILAEDDFLPHAMANRGRRLVYTTGILLLTVFAALILTAFGGITDRLIPLFAIGAFLAFTLSQAGMVQHWRKKKGKQTYLPLIVNSVGCVTTAAALVVILVAKFSEGAWITLILIPVLVWLFNGVRRHYVYVEKQIHCPQPIDLTGVSSPVVVIPINGWDSVAEKALRFALPLSEDIFITHVSTKEEEEKAIREKWNQYVEKPIAEAGLSKPNLVVLSSPYRRLYFPFLRFIARLKNEHPDRLIAVIIPELVESHWWQYPLHNQRATGLKAALLFRGGKQVVVINVPWYLNRGDSSGLPVTSNK